jgi:hypothetical protein
MLKNRTVIEVEVKGRVYRLECFSESPLEEVKEAIALMHGYISERISALPKPVEQEKCEPCELECA